MKWAGLWHRAIDAAGYRCLNMIAWENLSPIDIVGSVAGQLADGAQMLSRFYLKLDGNGGIKHLVLENTEVISGRAIGFDKLDARVLEVSKAAGATIVSMHEAAEWEIGQSLVLHAEAERSLRQLSWTVLAGGEPLDDAIKSVVEAAGVSMAPPEDEDVEPEESSVVCSACQVTNAAKAKFCIECGAKIVADSKPSGPAEISSIPIGNIDLGLPKLDMTVAELAFNGPDEDGYYSANVTFCVNNNADQDWGWVDLTCTLFNCAGRPLQNVVTEVSGISAQGSEDVTACFSGIKDALLLNNLEKAHVVAAATAFVKESHPIGQRTLPGPDAEISFGRIEIADELSVIDFSVLARTADEDDQVEVSTRCLVQNISTTSMAHLESVVLLEYGDDEACEQSGFGTTPVKPGHFELLEGSEWPRTDGFMEVQVKASINIFKPTSFGCVQRQGATIQSDVDASDDSGCDQASDDPDADSETAGDSNGDGAYRYFRGTVARIPDDWTLDSNPENVGVIGIGLPPLDDDLSPDRVVFRCFKSPEAFRWELESGGKLEQSEYPQDEIAEGIFEMVGRIATRLRASPGILDGDLARLAEAWVSGGDDLYDASSELDSDVWTGGVGSDDAIDIVGDDRADQAPGSFLVELYPDCNIPENEFVEGIGAIECFYQDNRDMDRHFFGIRFASDEEHVDDENDAEPESSFDGDGVIGQGTVVTIKKVVTDRAANVVDDGSEPLTYLHGGYAGIFERIEEALEGRRVGDSLTVSLSAAEAFGPRDEALVATEPRSAFPDDLEIGMAFEVADDAGETLLFRVTAISGEKVTLDANHALAGLALKFACTVLDVRPATDEEIENGDAS